MVIPLPDAVSFTDGAAFPIQVMTAYHMLHTVDSTGPGKTVLVHSAAGGVGHRRRAARQGRGRARLRHRVERRQGRRS